MTIVDAAAAIRRGELMPVELLERCLARIDLLEEKVRAWAYLDREGARADAERLTAELKRGHDRGPLHGIPVGIKDIIDVFDMPTGCGSKRWANSYARRDATVVARLRQAGAVIVGKTVTTAFASFDPPPTRNPWDLSRTPGGSSSGSAAAVACGMCLGALASQTGGSITRPASFCGVCSIKPTYGRVSLDGVLPLAPSMDHMGAMANCVRDLAILFQVIAGPDPQSGLASSGAVPDVLARISRDMGLWRQNREGPRFGLLGTMFTDLALPEMQEALPEFVSQIRWPATPLDQDRSDLPESDPTRVRDVVPPPEFSEITQRHQMMMAVEAAAYHEPRFKRHSEDYPARITGLIEEGLACPATEYHRTREHRQWTETACSDMLGGGTCSFFLTPATPGVAPDEATTGNPVFNSPWSYTGLPTVSFPIAWSPAGLPLAAQLIGQNNGEAALFAAAAWGEWIAERLCGFRRRKVSLT
jgi:aspartyl-tRNA(Asn)/glutamyl-tRNA(Gln) amidotransferase subunit A